MILILVTTAIAVWIFHQMYWRTRPYPPGPTPLPLLGNLHSILWEFPGQAPLNRWTKRYGKVFTHWLANIPVVSVTDYQAIHELFVRDGDSYADRYNLSSFTEEFRGGILGIIETSGAVWRDQRRFALHTLRDFGLGKEAMQERILDEAISLLDKLESESDSKGTAWPIQHIDQSVGSVINLVIFGYRFDEHTIHELHRNREVQDKLIALTKNPLIVLLSFFPKLENIWPFKQAKERVLRIRDEQFSFFERNIEIHRKRIDYSSDECDDFCDAYLKEMERRKDEPDSSFHDKMFVNVCIDLWSAGLDTTAMTMSWGTVLLLHHPEVQHKLHEEYDRVIRSDRLITMADKSALPYTAAYINELQRFSNIITQNLMRKTTKDVSIEGFKIPAGTAICPQISVLMCDPQIFPDPDTFNPSRFLDESGKLINVKELMPFSVGKRQCPGEGLARMELFLFFSNLVHRFKITPADPNNLLSLEKKLATMGKPLPFEMDEASVSQQCLVCSTPITSMHLGMDICRACSSFFKRTTVTGRQYPCRTGNRNCDTSKDGKFACRRCRFDKCLAIGMEYDGPMRVRRKPVISILQRIKAESKAFVARRRVQELKIIKSHGGHKRYWHAKEELYDVHPETCMEMYRIFIVESYEFFKNVFPAFATLHDKEQELIFKDYIGKMSMVEGYHRTRQIWGGTQKYMMCSIMTCYDVERAPLRDEMMGTENVDFLLSYTKNYAEDQNQIFLPMFNKCMLTEREYYALMALVLSELDSSCEISEDAQVIIDRYRQEVLEDLQLHYQNELCLKDFSARLGNLMSLNHSIQECKALFKVFFRFYTTIFDVYFTDDLLKDFFLMDILALPDVCLWEVMKIVDIKDRLNLRLTCRSFENLVAETNAGYHETGLIMREYTEEEREKVTFTFNVGLTTFTGFSTVDQIIYFRDRLFSGISFGKFTIVITDDSFTLDVLRAFTKKLRTRSILYFVESAPEFEKCLQHMTEFLDCEVHLRIGGFLPATDQLMSIPPIEKLKVVNTFFAPENEDETWVVTTDLFFRLLAIQKNLSMSNVVMNSADLKRIMKKLSSDTRERTVQLWERPPAIANWLRDYGITEASESGAEYGEFEVVSKLTESFGVMRLRYRNCAIRLDYFQWTDGSHEAIVTITNGKEQ